MKRTNLAAIVTTLLAGTSSTVCSAASATDPVFAFGLQGSYSVLKFTGRRSTATEHMPEGGLFLNFGNKMTAQTGLVYHAEMSGQYSEKQDEKIKDGQVDLDLGWRIALDARNFVDILLGGGYKWNRFQPDFNKYDIDLTSRTPFAKVAAGYNHQFSTTTLRLEAGVRKSINGDSKLKLHGISSETLDLKDTINPFVELSVLFNQQGAIPVIASLYYNRFKYDLDGQFLVTDFDKQTRDE
ncbi:outer membrane beta-barrel protein, partial [Pseudomonas frederiksbergensis]|uniref:outer membrane beta-barrel protein n=1 Tax=Pseudomonas frederiksbergensis TaxID=104087 RepID=UPI00197FBA5D